MEREFKYYPEDFGKLSVKVLHMDLVFDIFEDHTVVDSQLRVRALKDFDELSLDAKDLDVKSVACEDETVCFEYQKADNKLVLKFSNTVQAGRDISILTSTICRPSRNVLEGLYFDETLEGNPPQMITQCQQWGFQRLVPCFDDMAAKTTFTTKIIADSKYTHLISNGDVIVPRKELENGRSEIVYENKKVPMATYLFFLGVGNYDGYNKQLVYPDGKAIDLELLVFPGFDSGAAKKALDVLWHAVMWTHVFTGREGFNDFEKRMNLFNLLQKKSELLELGKISDANSLDVQIASISNGLKLGYEYTGKVYREIAMQNSNFGGMENVGNTTITANRIAPTKFSTDGSKEFMFTVKAHEFYHNQNGSEVTGLSPFELWLNEAATCRVERYYKSFISGSNYARLEEVQRLILPGGTLDHDSGATTMPIIARGFNSPLDLISAVTYSKGPEFIRMVELTIGRENFWKGLDNYYARFKHSNASSGQWIEEMEKVSGMDLKRMANVWLSQPGFPTVSIDSDYDGKNLNLKIRQEGFAGGMHWEFPFIVALVDEDGKDIVQQNFFVNNPEQVFTFPNVAKPKFLSLARGHSFYGRVKHAASYEELYSQALLDSDVINRYLALHNIIDGEKMRLFSNPSASVSKEFVELYFKLLNDEKLASEIGGDFFAITSALKDNSKKHYYQELFEIVNKLKSAIAKAHEDELISVYLSRIGKTIEAPYVEKEMFEIKNRYFKNNVLNIISSLDTPKVHELIKKQFFESSSASDKMAALRMLLNSSAAGKLDIMEEYSDVASKNLISWEAFLSAIGSNNAHNAIDLIKWAEKLKYFRIEQTTDQSALFSNFAHNKRLSLQSEEGRQYLKEIVLKLAPVNYYSANGILNVAGQLNDFPENYNAKLLKTFLEIYDELKPEKEKFVEVFNRLRMIIKKSENAISSYKLQFGEFDKSYLQ